MSTADLSPLGAGRYRLVGDEDTGVGVECSDHWDGGRPFAYYEGIRATYRDDPAVRQVGTIAELVQAILDHERHQHARRPIGPAQV